MTFRENKKKHHNTPCRLLISLIAAVTVLLCAAAPALAVTGEDIVDVAEQYIGYPYRYQAAGPDAFDCGGFVWYVCHEAGADFVLRSESLTLAAQNTPIYDKDELEPGDILFFGSSPESIDHWAIYAGDGMVIHAYNSTVGVVTTALDDVRPVFCYGCRLNSVSSYECPGLDAAVSTGLVPEIYQSHYSRGADADETATLLLLACRKATGLSSAELLGKDRLGNHQPDPWTDSPHALVNGVFGLAEKLASEEGRLNREDAAKAIAAAIVAPEKAPAIADGFAIEPGLKLPCLSVAADKEHIPSGRLIAAAETETTRYTRGNACVDMVRLYNILMSI